MGIVFYFDAAERKSNAHLGVARIVCHHSQEFYSREASSVDTFFLSEDYRGVLGHAHTTSLLAVAVLTSNRCTWQHRLCVFVSFCFSILYRLRPCSYLTWGTDT